MRLASRCQPAAALAGQRSFADAFTESFAPQPASANAANARTPSRFTVPLKPVNRDPGPREAVTRLQVVDELRPSAQRIVEAGLTRVARAGGQHAVGHRAR